MPILEFLVRNILRFMPTIFGFAFFGPLFAQIIDKLEWLPPVGLTTLSIGLIIGGAWGLVAQTRGSWIWFRP